MPGRWLPTLEQAAAWLGAEHANLHAAAEYTAGSGRDQHAAQIPTAMGDFLRRDGRWDQAAALQKTALTAARNAGDRHGEARALTELGLLAWLTGDYPTWRMRATGQPAAAGERGGSAGLS